MQLVSFHLEDDALLDITCMVVELIGSGQIVGGGSIVEIEHIVGGWRWIVAVDGSMDVVVEYRIGVWTKVFVRRWTLRRVGQRTERDCFCARSMSFWRLRIGLAFSAIHGGEWLDELSVKRGAGGWWASVGRSAAFSFVKICPEAP